MTRTIIGVDPGSLITGYGVVAIDGNRCQAIDFGCIKPPSKAPIELRYLFIFEGIEVLLEEHKPDVLVIETQYVDKNVQSAIKLGMARGVVVVAAAKKGIKIATYAPSEAKLAVTGKGNASKKQVQGMVKLLLGLQQLPEPEDAADALALAICHWNSEKMDCV